MHCVRQHGNPKSLTVDHSGSFQWYLQFHAMIYDAESMTVCMLSSVVVILACIKGRQLTYSACNFAIYCTSFWVIDSKINPLKWVPYMTKNILHTYWWLYWKGKQGFFTKSLRILYKILLFIIKYCNILATSAGKGTLYVTNDKLLSWQVGWVRVVGVGGSMSRLNVVSSSAECMMNGCQCLLATCLNTRYILSKYIYIYIYIYIYYIYYYIYNVKKCQTDLDGTNS